MPITAYDFMCEISVIIDEDNILGHKIDRDTEKKFEALLSKARQEAVEEYKQSLNNGN